MATVKKAVAKKAPAKRAEAPVVESRNDRVDWRSLYIYAVCLITLLVVLFSTVSLINSIMNAIFPDPAYIDVYATPENKPSVELLASKRRTIKFGHLRASSLLLQRLLLLVRYISITGAQHARSITSRLVRGFA